MLDAAWGHIAVRYGVWAPTQAVVMLSMIDPYDHLQVLSLLGGLKMTVSEYSVAAQYLAARSGFQLPEPESLRSTGSTVRCELKSASMVDVSVTRYNTANPPPPSGAGWTGLAPGDRLLDRFLSVTLEGGGRGDSGLMDRALIALYYTTADLDRNGDGDAIDDADINESTLSVYLLNGTSGIWSKLVAGQDGVDGLELNTTDFELYGRRYEGVIWLNLTRLALIGVAGRTNGGPLPVFARAGDDVSVFVGEEAVFNGSLSTGNGDIANFTWTFQYDNRTISLFGPSASFVFQVPGNYTVTLTVTDSLGFSTSDTMTVVVQERPSGKWLLRVGPVTDENGTALAGALVNLSVGGSSLSNTTDGVGMAVFELGPEHVGKGASLSISKDGYLPAEYATNITSGRVLERNPPPLVRMKPDENLTRPDENFTLGIGPVKDAKGNAVEGALVTITAGGKTYTNYTDAHGNATFVLALSLVGKDVSLRIEKEGYSPVSFDTRISSGRKLEQNPPAMQKMAKPAPEGNGPSWVLPAAAIVIVLIVLLAAVLMRRKRPVAAGEEPDGGGPESKEAGTPKDGPPPVPPIEKAGSEIPGGAATSGVLAPEPAAQEQIPQMRKTGGS
jgi:PKD repeat protein